MKTRASRHSPESVARAATLFFTVRGLLRTKLAQGRRLDPYAWLRIETMVYIRDNAGSSMKDIAAYLSITAPSATSLINALARAGLIERRTDSRDKRALRVYLSKKGQGFLKKAVDNGMEVLRSLFAPLSPRDLATFAQLLELIKKGDEQPSV